MPHPLEDVIQGAEGFLLIGDSSEERFPAFSYHVYTKAKKSFYCLDLGGLEVSRGKTKGGRVYTRVEDLPADHDDLAILWMKPRSAVRGVEAAHAAGCRRVWFSFQTGHPSAVERARELGMEVVEVGRCPVYYMDRRMPECTLHTLLVKTTGLWGQPPRTDANAKRRELI